MIWGITLHLGIGSEPTLRVHLRASTFCGWIYIPVGAWNRNCVVPIRLPGPDIHHKLPSSLVTRHHGTNDKPPLIIVPDPKQSHSSLEIRAVRSINPLHFGHLFTLSFPNFCSMTSQSSDIEQWRPESSTIKDSELVLMRDLLGDLFKVYHLNALGGINLAYNPEPEHFLAMHYDLIPHSSDSHCTHSSASTGNGLYPSSGDYSRPFPLDILLGGESRVTRQEVVVSAAMGGNPSGGLIEVAKLHSVGPSSEDAVHVLLSKSGVTPNCPASTHTSSPKDLTPSGYPIQGSSSAKANLYPVSNCKFTLESSNFV
ncbi:unnamed protein product [Cuscuta campestris]|uniref:Uncharacterized protein n=1 Tax=Cuscuta campestris TaxID=132261 RepID=A0A484LL64_9ASTE|nr:unnamed protein product [Cuscuta campestris]